MPFDEEYYKSDEFLQLLNSYEAAKDTGDNMFFDADELVDIADYYNMKGEQEQALAVVEQGLTLYPDHVLLNVFMARRALDDADIDEAERYAQQIGEKDSPDYHYLCAEILIAQDRIDEADRYLRDYATTVEPDEYGDFVKDVANLYVDYNVSYKAYEWMMRTAGDDSDDFKELMGRALFGLGKYKDSQRIFNELIDHNPFSKQYWTALATAQYMDEEYDAAVTSSEYAIAIDPNDPDSLLAKANGLMKLANYEQAAEYFKRFSQICPDDVIGPLHQAGCLVNLGRNLEAIPLLEHALTMANDDEFLAQIYQELAFAYSANGELDRALEAIDHTKSLDCDHADMLVIRGHLLLSHQRIDEAEECFNQAISQGKGDPNIILRVIISLYDNRYIKAAYLMLKRFYALDANNEFTNGFVYLALCCWELHYDKEFLRYLKKAALYNPTETRLVLGHIFPDDMSVDEYYSYMKEHIHD
ncbi:MAG: tetratricopeptide repeat protein [Prevotella sp.]|nr:tetratricopeptide repeat protein [Prevotella sp.]